jgi:hypothetical protein
MSENADPHQVCKTTNINMDDVVKLAIQLKDAGIIDIPSIKVTGVPLSEYAHRYLPRNRKYVGAVLLDVVVNTSYVKEEEKVVKAGALVTSVPELKANIQQLEEIASPLGFSVVRGKMGTVFKTGSRDREVVTLLMGLTLKSTKKGKQHAI